MSAENGAGLLMKRIPGRSRPREEVLQKVNDERAQMRAGMPSALWSMFIPDVDGLYRWRVQLECGCVTEVITRGDQRFPDGRVYDDPVGRASLPHGELRCPADHQTPRQYREIVEYLERTVRDSPPNPVDDPWGVGEEVWAKIRCAEPRTYAVWRVKFDCGHHTDQVSDLDWNPGDSPKLATIKRTNEMVQELEEYWAAEPAESRTEEADRDHTRRMLQLRWPRPEPEQGCFTCTRVFRMIGYQRIGWLIPRPKPAKPAPDDVNCSTPNSRTPKPKSNDYDAAPTN